ncbi:MFS transporter [Kribbella jejuensis]|uniref:Putative MFS family arabinose efflux permease n=1 Tax=Kribbella jejuensis TaxID=236068 RepID=A0A542DSC5_9ACTN|nr:MFS transporter [Kribbella jejuensis]TQJ05999.1 putative MFS family arabinose efflux permease [Kribbella jejuensis]
MTAERILRTYLTLVAVSTGASSMIWGINTVFLLDAGLSIGQAFAANAFFTAGMVLFEVPTGVIADTVGRRTSYLLGTATLIGTTLAYLLLWRVHAPFGWWAVVSALLGLGFTFFSGATEAWLVDGLHATGYAGSLDAVFAKGQVVNGIAMMAGSIGGGVLAQLTNLGIPYVLRALLLAATFAVAWRAMHDTGFTPKPRTSIHSELTTIVRASLRHGLLNHKVRWVMLAGPFTAGVSVYGFYAAQPYLLNLYGHTHSYAVAGLTAGVVAAAQITGGALAPRVARLFPNRIQTLMGAIVVSGVMIAALGLVTSFWAALILLMVWASMFAAMVPVRQAYLNSHIPSEQRATVLSFDNLLGSAGGVVLQPALGRTADVWGYGPAYLVSAVVQLIAVPVLARTKAVETTGDQPLALRA